MLMSAVSPVHHSGPGHACLPRRVAAPGRAGRLPSKVATIKAALALVADGVSARGAAYVCKCSRSSMRRFVRRRYSMTVGEYGRCIKAGVTEHELRAYRALCK